MWLDGYKTPNVRSKVKVIKNWDGEPPAWNFDGSSTSQAIGSSSECVLQPVRTYSLGENWHLVLCEVMNADGTPHSSNMRAKLREVSDFANNHDFWWGFEQEYFLTKNRKPLGFPEGGYPDPQGLYYCGVGGNQVEGRNVVLRHLEQCLSMGIELTGVNAEVAAGQWEFQCFGNNTLKACDDLWVSRYMLYRIAEEFELDADIRPKPVKGDWNGSGCHTNFSDMSMRDGSGGKQHFDKILESLRKRHDQHIKGYGEDNDQRLTGLHETQHFQAFTSGVADRGASVRIPSDTARNWSGYLEDRRPASNCDPYWVALLILEAAKQSGNYL